MTKRILVTGATGFIGRHSLGELVSRGYEVVALTSPVQLKTLLRVLSLFSVTCRMTLK